VSKFRGDGKAESERGGTRQAKKKTLRFTEGNWGGLLFEVGRSGNRKNPQAGVRYERGSEQEDEGDPYNRNAPQLPGGPRNWGKKKLKMLPAGSPEPWGMVRCE